MRTLFIVFVMFGTLLTTGCANEPPSQSAQRTSEEPVARNVAPSHGKVPSNHPLQEHFERIDKLVKIRQSLGDACQIKNPEKVPVVDFDYPAYIATNGKSFIVEGALTAGGGLLVAVSNDAFQDFRAANGLNNEAVEIYKLSPTVARQLMDDTLWVKNKIVSAGFPDDEDYFVTSRKCFPKVQ
ncbi:MAG TPA: hypothetical protein VFM68_04445 [Candidatus Saccharimonadales bacterium]|nr:hypothetical protein [Candidatus Saccharimonadales bacterium]